VGRSDVDSAFRGCGDTLVRLPGRLRHCAAAARALSTRSNTIDPQEFTVAAVCDICAKKPGFGNNRPWSRKITKRRFDPNIQRVRAVVNGTPKRMNVCTGCLKAGKVSR
jgi:large subunit ribosomal protein L28